MKNVKLIIILLLIIAFTTAGYFFIAKFSTPIIPKTQSETPSLFCQQNQLSATISAEAAAGNVYATLTLTNKGKTSCEVILGDTVTAKFDAKNISVNYEANIPSQNDILAPGAKVYSQIHFPNGPQCQSAIILKPVTFFYKTDQTLVAFKSTGPGEQLIVSACSAEKENTVIDIWPLSSTTVTQ